jgi:hypothetical protein
MISRPTILPLPVAVVLSYPALDFNFTSWMSPDNLRVLRSEQSSGNLPGLRELAAQKDHLKHVVCLINRNLRLPNPDPFQVTVEYGPRQYAV